MTIYRWPFKTQREALDGAARGIEKVEGDALAASTLAGVTPAGLAPVAMVSVVSVEALPAGAGLSGYSKALLKITGPDGRAEFISSHQPTANLEAAVSPASGKVTVTVTSSTKSTLTAVARIAEYVELSVSPGAETALVGAHALPAAALNVTSTAGFPPSGYVDLGPYGIVAYTGLTATTFTGASGGTGAPGTGVRVSEAISLPTTARFEDPASGKNYEPDAATQLGPGKRELKIKESDSAEAGDVSYGSPLEVLSAGLAARDYARIVGPAIVVDMKTATVAAASPLVDAATGKTYETGVLVTLTSAGRSKTGVLSAAVTFRRLADAVADTTSAAVGTELTFSPILAGVVSTATVASVGGGTLPKDHVLTRSDGKTYTVTTETVVPDSLTAEAPIVASERGAASDLVLASTLTLSAPTGIVSPVTVSDVTPWGAYPEVYPAQPVGAPVTWASAVVPLSDGRWEAVVYTEPYGS